MTASPVDNTLLLRDLQRDGHIRTPWVDLLDMPAPFAPGSVAFGRIRGMLLGLAIGDALGNTSESQNPGDRLARYGEIRDYLRNPYAEYRKVGAPSDDTQLAFWTLEHLIEEGGLYPAKLAALFAERRIFGIGGTVASFVSQHQAGVPWYEAGPNSAGNGALMRIAPILLPHLRTGDRRLWSDATLCAAITHNSATSISACIAFVGLLGELLVAERPPSPDWWVNRYVELARVLEGEEPLQPRGGHYLGWKGPLWGFVAEHLPEAARRGIDTRSACDAWYSGAYLLETVPSALYILMRHAGDPEIAIVRAVNDTRDNDTVAAIVGAAVGALHGEEALPQRWRTGLLGRTAANDDGAVMNLLTRAEESFSADSLRIGKADA